MVDVVDSLDQTVRSRSRLRDWVHLFCPVM